MALFGSFEYGSGTVYGIGLQIVDIAPLTRQLVRLTLSEPVITDSNYYLVENYSVTTADGSNTLSVRCVLPFGVDTYLTDEVILYTDHSTVGAHYRVSLSSLISSTGSTQSAIGDFIARNTKSDAMYNSLPSHYDKRPISRLSGLVLAVSQEDELIGGSRYDHFLFTKSNIEGRPPTPMITGESLGSSLFGTSSDITRISVFVDGVVAGDADIEPSGDWTFEIPAELYGGGPVTVDLAALGPGGIVTLQFVAP